MTPLPQWMEDAKARAEAATPGPWKVEHCDYALGQKHDDEFIAASRTDIPRLLRACEVMNAALTEVKMAQEDPTMHTFSYDDVCAALDEVAKL